MVVIIIGILISVIGIAIVNFLLTSLLVNIQGKKHTNTERNKKKNKKTHKK
jgi:hypothetical protein